MCGLEGCCGVVDIDIWIGVVIFDGCDFEGFCVIEYVEDLVWGYVFGDGFVVGVLIEVEFGFLVGCYVYIELCSVFFNEYWLWWFFFCQEFVGEF